MVGETEGNRHFRPRGKIRQGAVAARIVVVCFFPRFFLLFSFHSRPTLEDLLSKEPSVLDSVVTHAWQTDKTCWGPRVGPQSPKNSLTFCPLNEQLYRSEGDSLYRGKMPLFTSAAMTVIKETCDTV